ncbi:MAG: tape measure protein, partial [Acidobacteria bacterium]|nr:tape measure protein [Acidobacteriota bacterium]
MTLRVILMGDRAAREGLNSTGREAARASKGVDLLNRSLRTLGGALAAREIFRLADGFTNMQNRLRVLTPDLAKVSRLTDELFQISLDTRTSIEATTVVFTRLGLSTRELGLTMQELLNITKALNQAVILSGATADEARGGLIQFTQGLAVGVLRGDELRSVLEQMIVVSEVIGDKLGVARGALRLLGEQGKITSKVIVDSLIASMDQLNERFARTIPTIEQAFTNLRTSVIKFLGDLNQATGLFSGIARAIIFISDRMDFFGRVVLGVIVTTGLRSLVSLLDIVILKNFKLLTILKAVRAALISTFSFGLGLLVAFSDQIVVIQKNQVTLAEFAAGAFSAFARQLSDMAGNAEEAATQIANKFVEPLTGIKFTGIADAFATAMDSVLAVGKGVFTSLVLIFDRLPELLKASFQRASSAVKKELNDLLPKSLQLDLGDGDVQLTALGKRLKTRIEEINRSLNDPDSSLGVVAIANLKKELETLQPAFQKALLIAPKTKTQLQQELDILLDGVKESFRKSFKDTNFFSSILEGGRAGGGELAVARIARERLKSLVDFIDKLGKEGDKRQALQIIIDDENRKIKENVELARLDGAAREERAGILRIENELRQKSIDLTDAATKAALEELKVNQRQLVFEQARADVRKKAGISNAEFLFQEKAIRSELNNFNIDLDEANLQLNQLAINSIKAGDGLGALKIGFLEVDTSARALGESISQALVGAINSAADALADFAASGFRDTEKLREAFANLFQDLAKQILATIIKLLVLKAIQLALGDGAPAVGTTTNFLTSQGLTGTVTTTKQAGGPLRAGQPSIVGEQGPELFVPNTSGRVVPN